MFGEPDGPPVLAVSDGEIETMAEKQVASFEAADRLLDEIVLEAGTLNPAQAEFVDRQHEGHRRWTRDAEFVSEHVATGGHYMSIEALKRLRSQLSPLDLKTMGRDFRTKLTELGAPTGQISAQEIERLAGHRNAAAPPQPDEGPKGVAADGALGG